MQINDIVSIIKKTSILFFSQYSGKSISNNIVSEFYVDCGFDILLKASFTKSSQVITIGT